MNELDIYKISNIKSKNIKIGELTKEAIDILNLNLKPQNISIWSPRIREHCEKHKQEYSSIEEYNRAIRSIPLIIQQPDYIGLHSNGNIQYIKKINDISLVGIKTIKGNNNLLFRTIFPITEDKLDYYIATKKVYKYKREK